MHTAIVTGGTRGIGRAIATALAGHGHAVMLTGRSAEQVDAAVTALREETGAGQRVQGRVVDVRRRADVDQLVAEAVAAFGSLTLLVNTPVSAPSRPSKPRPTMSGPGSSRPT